jgi:hypothetical protein
VGADTKVKAKLDKFRIKGNNRPSTGGAAGLFRLFVSPLLVSLVGETWRQVSRWLLEDAGEGLSLPRDNLE